MARALLTALITAALAPALPAQQSLPGGADRVFDLRTLVDLALNAGGDMREAELGYEQARLQYEQTKARNGVSLAATASVAQSDDFDVEGTTAAGSDVALGTSGQAGLTMSLPNTSASLTAKHRIVPPPSAGVSTEWRNSSSVTLSASCTVWDGTLGGSARLTLEQALGTLRSRALSLVSARSDVAVRVAQAYYAMLSAQRTMELRAATVEQRAAELERTRILVDSGRATEIDRRQAEINEKSAEIDRRAATASLRSATARLAVLAGMDPDARFAVREVEDPAVPLMSIEEDVRTAMENRTDLKQLRLTRSSGDLELRQARAGASPQVTVSGSGDLYRSWDADTLGGDWTARLQVSIPILDSGLVRRQIDAAVVQNAATDRQVADLEKTVRLDVADAIAAAEEAEARIELARLSLEQAGLRHELAKTEEELGTGSPLDTLTASVNVTSAQAALLKARNDLQLALLQYRQALGI